MRSQSYLGEDVDDAAFLARFQKREKRKAKSKLLSRLEVQKERAQKANISVTVGIGILEINVEEEEWVGAATAYRWIVSSNSVSNHFRNIPASTKKLEHRIWCEALAWARMFDVRIANEGWKRFCVIPDFEISVRRLMAVEMTMEQRVWELARHVKELSVVNDSAMHEVLGRTLSSAKIAETYRKASKHSQEDREKHGGQEK